jgi:hypothetical protein
VNLNLDFISEKFGDGKVAELNLSPKMGTMVKNIQKPLAFIQKFISSSTSYNKDTPVYIDSDLGKGLKGEELSKGIFDLGFKNIYLATGKRKVDIKVPYWIKKVQGKGFYVQ